jgi:hypothetical protein
MAKQAKPHSAASVCRSTGSVRRCQNDRDSSGRFIYSMRRFNQRRPDTLSSGSRIHSYRRRRSSITLASTSMPDFSGMALP